MKKLMLIAGALSLACAVSAQSNTVTSVNAAGFVKRSVAKGKLEMVSIPFEAFDGNPKTAAELFGSSLPYGTTLHYWDPVGQTYRADVYTQGFFGSPDAWSPGTHAYTRGEGFFVEIIDNASATQNQYDLFLFGEVPDSRTAPSTTNEFPQVNGLYMVGFHYPVEVAITNISFGITPDYGDTIHVWQQDGGPGGNGGWTSVVYQQGFFGSPDKWSNESLVIQPGQGFFYESKGSKSWETVKSDFYTWP